MLAVMPQGSALMKKWGTAVLSGALLMLALCGTLPTAAAEAGFDLNYEMALTTVEKHKRSDIPVRARVGARLDSGGVH